MEDPTLWQAISGMFVLAGLLHAVRAARRSDARRAVHLALGGACLVWAVAAALWRFSSSTAGYGAGAVALGLMLWAALLSAKARK